MRILVTGATGFVGAHLCPALARPGVVVRAALRTNGNVPAASEKISIGDLHGSTDWSRAVRGVDCVVHLASRVHVLNDTAGADAYIATNADGTERLASDAAQAGVRQFIFLSSAKVNGEVSGAKGFSANDPPDPQGPYPVSKWAAEQRLAAIDRASSMCVSIVRPPLIYGPGVRANFYRLMRWIDRGWPLPFGAIENRRSLVSVWNLCDLLARLVGDPLAGRGLWMVSDGCDMSTPQLVEALGRAMGRRVRLLPIPRRALQVFGRIVGRQEELARLCDSLTVDISATRDRLGWDPPVAVGESLSRTADWYRSIRSP